MTCPFCESDDVELVSPWGGQIITCQMRCKACNTYFEAIREDFDGGADEVREDFDGGADESEAPRSWTTCSADDR